MRTGNIRDYLHESPGPRTRKRIRIITGFVLKSTVIRICGIVASIGGFFLALQFSGAEQLYVMAGVAVVALIIPGLVVYLQNKE